MNTYIFNDVETRSHIDLSKSNPDIYAKHHSSDLICMAWKIPGSPVYDFLPGDPMPFDFDNYKDLYLVAHNALFEYAVYKHILVPRYNFPKWTLAPERWIDTMAMCQAAGVPAKLELAAEFLHCKNQKLDTGTRLINMYSKPVKDKKTGKLSFRTMPEKDLEEMKEYNRVDVLATEEIFNTLSRLPNNALERKIWVLSFKQNITGINIDRGTMTLVKAALTDERKKAEKRMKELEVNVRSHPQLKEYFRGKEFPINDIQATTLEKIENSTDDPEVLEMLGLRKILAPASVKKYDAMEARTDGECILRHWSMYWGAHTGRWSSKGVQLHNLPRSGIKPGDIAGYIEKIRKGDYNQLSLIEYAKKIIPGLLIPKRDYVFIKGDFSAIEARVLAGLAGEKNLVRMFAEGAKIYEIMAALIFSCPVGGIAPESLERFVGKETVLGSGFGMGHKRHNESCKQKGKAIPLELSKKAIDTFRGSNPNIVKFWYALQNAFILVWRSKGKSSVNVGQYITVTGDGKPGYIRVILPSTRSLYYHRVKYKDNQLSFYSPEKKTRIKIWGGFLAENVTQATARDVLVNCMLTADKGGLDQVLHVHDEIVCQVHKDNYKRELRLFNEIMNTPPEWLKELPLKTESEICERYYK